jgi:CheY-like chemotaxis protein
VTSFNGRAARVLFVDDDAATRAGYATHLSKLGYEVIGAEGGDQALALATTWAPDVIVLDLGLPDVDGWEVARRLKDGPATCAIPIVAVTGADLPHERVSAMRAGCDRHLAKPCAPADLVDAIERCMRASSI